jgi:integrase-like protein
MKCLVNAPPALVQQYKKRLTTDGSLVDGKFATLIKHRPSYEKQKRPSQLRLLEELLCNTRMKRAWDIIRNYEQGEKYYENAYNAIREAMRLARLGIVSQKARKERYEDIAKRAEKLAKVISEPTGMPGTYTGDLDLPVYEFLPQHVASNLGAQSWATMQSDERHDWAVSILDDWPTEVALLLDTAKTKMPRYYALFLCAARTGLRMGELLALQWPDIDWQSRFIEVRRSYTHFKVTTPKSGESRRVDMSKELTQTLKDLLLERQIEAGATGTEVPLWVFPSETGGLLHPHNIRDRIFYGLLTKAKLRRVRFHDLRHTFASLLLQNGESPVYVKEQMEHSSIQITVDLYGHLIPGSNRQAVDRLDTPVESAFVAAQSATQAQPLAPTIRPVSTDRLESPVVTGKRSGVSDGFRTRDLRIHNPAL